MANGNKRVSKHLQRKLCKDKKKPNIRIRLGRNTIDLKKRGFQKATYRCPICKRIHEEEY